MAQETQNQTGADPQFALRTLTGLMQAANHHANIDTARGMRLRIEEQLGVHHMVCRCAFEVGPCQVEKILLLQQHAGASVINVEKTLQVGKGIGRTQRIHARIRQLHAIALGQFEDQFRFQRTFDVNVQLGLGRLTQQFRQTSTGNGVKIHGSLARNLETHECTATSKRQRRIRVKWSTGRQGNKDGHLRADKRASQ